MSNASQPLLEKKPPAPAVLVADDEELVRQLAGFILRADGFEVLLATDGPGALELLAGSSDVRLALVDLNMPGPGGPALVAQVHALRPGLPVLVMSGEHPAEVEAQFAGADVAGFLQKPFTRQDILDRVHQIIPGRGA